MSAFFVGVDHVNAMLTFADHASRDYNFTLPDSTWSVRRRGEAGYNEDALTAIGKALLAENIASLKHCYPKGREGLGDWQEYFGDELPDLEAYRYKPDLAFFTAPGVALATIKLVDCYEYQACEHDAWKDSYAAKFTNELARCAASRLPGYDNAAWRYERTADLVAL